MTVTWHRNDGVSGVIAVEIVSGFKMNVSVMFPVYVLCVCLVVGSDIFIRLCALLAARRTNPPTAAHRLIKFG